MGKGLTDEEVTALRWMISCNKSQIGFLGPTVKRDGALPQYCRLVSLGLATVVVDQHQRRRAGRFGYWIAPAGRAVLTPEVENG